MAHHMPIAPILVSNFEQSPDFSKIFFKKIEPILAQIWANFESRPIQIPNFVFRGVIHIHVPRC